VIGAHEMQEWTTMSIGGRSAEGAEIAPRGWFADGSSAYMAAEE
jgi:hypothetical protein